MAARTGRSRDLVPGAVSRWLLALLIISMSGAERGHPVAVEQRPCGFTCNGSCAIEPDKNTTASPLKPSLTCRSQSSLAVEWSAGLMQHRRLLAQIEEQNEEEFAGECFNVTSSTLASFHNLSEAKDYRVKLWSVSERGQLSLAGASDWLSTLSSNNTLSPVPRVWLADKPHPCGTGNELETVIKWEPSKELPCSYSILVYQPHTLSIYQKEIREPDKLYSTTIRELYFESTYNVMIWSTAGNLESNKTELTFTTPSCLSVHNSLKVCLPPTPVILSVESVNSPPDKSRLGYDITIRWEVPELKPDNYIVELYASTINGSIMRNTSGVENQLTFNNIHLNMDYQVSLIAVSPAGNSSKAYEICRLRPTTGSTVSSVVIYAVIIPLASFLVFMGVAAFVYHRHEKMKLTKRRCRYFEELEQKAPHDLSATISINMEDDQFEVKPEHLLIYDVLGEGAFGVVKKGWYPDKNKEVAIKMLKDEPSAEEVKQFKQEIDMMKSVGSHPHIVSLLGCCTRPSATMMLVVEFCPKGDLQSYLRLAWDIMSSKIKPSSADKSSYNEDEISEQIEYTPLNSTNSEENAPNLIINKLYDYQDKLDTNITAIDLLSFSRQIAMGMEYLSLNRVVHRDLAARNVLVCNDKTVKIADFGLSRDIYQENVYRKTGTGKLPIKWMALECLTHQIYTTQSDVWSYGVLMWEIITLGGNPYPSIPTGKLLKLLLSGYRMECPSNCSPELYALMMACWRARPKERPTFTELREMLDALLNGVCSKEYLSMDIINYKDIEDFRKVISDQPSRESDKSQDALKPGMDSDWYMMPITHNKSPKQSLLNHYSIMPSQPPLYPAPTTTVESTDCVTKLMLSAQAANNNGTAIDSSRWC